MNVRTLKRKRTTKDKITIQKNEEQVIPVKLIVLHLKLKFKFLYHPAFSI